MSYRNTIVGHMLGYGNSYSEIIRGPDGEVAQLWILDPGKVKPARTDDGKLFYWVTGANGQRQEVQPERLFRVPGFGFDGVQGYNVISYARQSMGLARGAEKYGAQFFGNGAKASLVFEMPQELTEKSSDNLIRSIQKQVGGNNKHGILLAEQGAKFSTLAVSQKDSQYLETRQFTIPEICRWFRLQPHKISDLTRATFSNIEEQNIDYVVDTLTPWFVRIEQAIRMQLMTPEQKAENLYAKHNVNALLRGNIESRYKAYNTGIMTGWLTRNEAREFEDLNPLDGLDDPLVPLNMTVVGEEPIETGTNDAFIEDAAGRIANTEKKGLVGRIIRASEDRERFNEWAASFYCKQQDYVIKCLGPLNLGADASVKILQSGIVGITVATDPGEYIQNWNRKQEIVDIIKEALLCTTR
jgi:HK97 family phage portal protein